MLPDFPSWAPGGLVIPSHPRIPPACDEHAKPLSDERPHARPRGSGLQLKPRCEGSCPDVAAHPSSQGSQLPEWHRPTRCHATPWGQNCPQAWRRAGRALPAPSVASLFAATGNETANHKQPLGTPEGSSVNITNSRVLELIDHLCFK